MTVQSPTKCATQIARICGMLGSAHDGERAAAALSHERQRLTACCSVGHRPDNCWFPPQHFDHSSSTTHVGSKGTEIETKSDRNEERGPHHAETENTWLGVERVHSRS